ncbi:MAG: SigB/SigF/SigG family RNA polymerase sigma factor [Firmicutes bacterium]|nr:SigB/SigF/SigG family RNA polymerase sigma factor [Bacillota bacterium]
MKPVVDEARADISLPQRPLLGDEKTRLLLEQAQGGDREARDTLVQHNLRLVLSIARRYAGRGRDIEDLFQIGCLGLLKAIDNFDLSYDVRFSTYAVPLIMGEIRQYLRKEGPITVGRALQDLASQAIKTRDDLTQTLNRSPTISEISQAMGVDREEVAVALASTQPVSSLQDVIKEDEGQPIHLEGVIADEGEQTVEGLALRQVITRLAPREQKILIWRFLQEKTQTQIANELGISQAQVSRIEKTILRTLRQMLS